MKKRLKINIKKLTICILASWLGIGFLTAQPQNELGTPFIKNYIPKQYKGFPQIFGVTQDTNGIIYFTGNGIVEYDGNSWRKIPPLGAVTWSIVLGNDGLIYVGGTDDLGYLIQDSLGRQQFISLKSLVPKEHSGFGQLRQATVVGDDIYFASKTGYLIKYDSKEQRIRTWKREPFYTLLGNINEALFLDVPGIGLSKVVGEEIEKVPGGEFFADILLTTILPLKNDRYLICTKSEGLFLYENNNFSPFETEADQVLKSWVYGAKMLPDDTYVFSVIGQGIVVLDQTGKWINHLKKEDGLLDDIILSVHSSPSGPLWLGANSGLCQVEILSPFSNFNVDENNNPLFIEDVIRFEDNLYVASASTNGFLHLDKNGQVFREVKNIPHGQAFSFTKISNQLLGVGNTGIYQIEGEKAEPIYQENEDAFFILSLHESRLKSGHFFLGLQDGLASIYKRNPKWFYDGRQEKIPRNVAIKSFLENQPGEIWAGTESQGLWRINYQLDNNNPEKITITKVQSFLKGIENRDLENTAVYDINDKITFTGVGGIFIFDPIKNRIVPDSRFSLPVPKTDIQRIILAEDKQGQVYAHFLYFDGTAELGVYLLQSDGNYIFDSKPFQKLPKEEILNVSKLYPDENDVLWIAGQDGIFRFDGQKTPILHPFSVKIRSVHIGEDSLLFSGHGVLRDPILTYAQNDIQFHFLSVNININGQNQYQTQLEGFDGDWSEWNTKIDRAYTNLPEGNYTFKVRGKAPSGALGKEASYSFKIVPPWWRMWWAYLGYVVLSISILSLFSRYRNRRLRKQRENLQQIVKERTQEIEQKIEELSAINSVQEGLVAQIDINGIYQLVGDQVQELFKANIAYIAILDQSKETIHFPYGYGDDFPDMEFGEGLTSQIITTGTSLLINQDVSKTHQELGIEESGKKAASYLGVPIVLRKEIIGVISIQSTEHTNHFDETDERLLGTIASQVGIALHNAQLFEEAETARAVAEEASAAKSTFLSTVSHELRTPLTSVIGFAKIIKKRLDERILPHVQSEEKKTQRAINQVNQNLDVVISEGERLTTLINTVLDLAKIEAGRLDWNMELIPIEKVIKQASAATSSLFEQKSLPLNLDIAENLPLIKADKDRLVQVVINLISNAVKFTDEGEVKVKAFLQNESIIVAVKDSGIGISKEDLPKVFEKFKQVGDTLTDKPKGTGLGLPICKEIIEHHHGDIWVESEFGQGSTFLFSLPLKTEFDNDPNAEGVLPLHKIPEIHLNKKKVNGRSIQNSKKTILVVDDEPSIRSLLRQEISEVGYQIKEAVNGKDALRSIREEQPDLVVLDVMMPEMNGFDVAAILKNDPSTQDIPIIVVSIVDDKQRINRLGIDRYLTKPIDTGLLLKEIDTLLSK